MSASDEESLAASQLLEALREGGVETIFANLGSDHPAIIEALAIDRERGIDGPAVMLCPHEHTALSAAHGYSAATGRPSAVFVHTDVGTANLGGAVHNAARAHVPVLIVAGLTPYTLEGELPGGRNTAINDLQDIKDQHGIVRPYVKWSYDLRTGRNVKQVVHRALQIAQSAPGGPVYMTAAREVLAERVPPRAVDVELWRPVERVPAPEHVVSDVLRAVDRAERPMIVTSSLGRRPEAAAALLELVERVGVGVVEVAPEHLNLPVGHPLHLGGDAGIVASSDLVLAIDVDSPWLPSAYAPPPGAPVWYVDPDPLKLDMPLWYRPSRSFVVADSALFLEQLLAAEARDPVAPDRRSARLRWGEGTRVDLPRRAPAPSGRATAADVGAALGELLEGDAVIVNEAITNSGEVWARGRRTRAGTYVANRGTSLGWSGGAALGVKLAVGPSLVVSVVGDGAYHLSEPMSVQWLAERYDLPTLTVVLDNGGWGATRRNLRRQYPGGTAESTGRHGVDLSPSARFADAAEGASGAFGATVRSADDLVPELTRALGQVAGGRAAVVHVLLDPITG